MSSMAILGGTFDPPHFGHLHLAECALHQLGIDRIVFMPTGDPYFKTEREVSPAGHRLEMLKLATRDHAAFQVDARELRRAGPTYTVDTLRSLHADGISDITLLLGADNLADLPAWREHAAVISLAHIAVALRGTFAEQIPAISRAAGLETPPTVLDMADFPLSSTLIRGRVSAGKPIRYLLPHAVESYILRNGLYRHEAAA